MNWQVVSLIEALGALRGRIAELCRDRERERREFAQKLEAAKDALARQERAAREQQSELELQLLEVERLREDLARAFRERDEARQLLDRAEPPAPVAGPAEERDTP